MTMLGIILIERAYLVMFLCWELEQFREATHCNSITEAEFVAATSCVCHVVWLRRNLDFVGFKQEGVTLIFCGNTSIIKLSKNPVILRRRRRKHINVKYLYLKRSCSSKSYWACRSEEQVTDIFLKGLKLDSFNKLKMLLVLEILHCQR